ncbi:MAG: CopG family transcriptional regulator [Acidobacteria bacterium]|nr:MAG: CopG family transcriptional regulator [Acidobacteriota bacterium]
MQKNVTIRLSEEAADWARIEAAKKKTSVSRMLGEMLEREMQREAEHRRAFQNWTQEGRWPQGRPEPGWRFSREETHERGHHDWSK